MALESWLVVWVVVWLKAKAAQSTAVQQLRQAKKMGSDPNLWVTSACA
jgi:hypothetical protein